MGDFVQGAAAQDAPDAGDARVAPHLEDGTGALVGTEQLFQALFSIHVHGSELEDGEFLPIAADPALDEQDGAGAVEADQQGDQGEKRQQQQQGSAGDQDVEEAAQARIQP